MARKRSYASKLARRYKSRRKLLGKRMSVHRPLVIWTGKKFRRPKHSKLFPRPTRINPRRSRRLARRHSYRRNPLRLPKLPFGLDRSLMQGLPVAGGIALSMFAMPQIAKYVPASMQKYSKFYGAIHVALGVAAMTLVKKDIVKTLGGTMLAMGLYDLLASNVPQLNLPALPRGAVATGSSYGADEIVGSSYDQVGTDFTPAASYGDDIDYGGDALEIG